MSHIYYCKLLNEDNSELISYQKIYNGNISEQIKIYHRFEENLKLRDNEGKEDKHPIQIIKSRKKKRKKPPCDPLVDPLLCKIQ
jgi:hypothetical protein